MPILLLIFLNLLLPQNGYADSTPIEKVENCAPHDKDNLNALKNLTFEILGGGTALLKIKADIDTQGNVHKPLNKAFWNAPLGMAAPNDKKSREWFLDQINNRFIAAYHLASSISDATKRAAAINQVNNLFESQGNTTLFEILNAQNYSFYRIRIHEPKPSTKINELENGHYASASTMALTIPLQAFNPAMRSQNSGYLFQNITAADLVRTQRKQARLEDKAPPDKGDTASFVASYQWIRDRQKTEPQSYEDLRYQTADVHANDYLAFQFAGGAPKKWEARALATYHCKMQRLADYRNPPGKVADSNKDASPPSTTTAVP